MPDGPGSSMLSGRDDLGPADISGVGIYRAVRPLASEATELRLSA
jgi:hypothetical protein